MENYTFEDKSRKARKEHRCIWCGEMVKIGEIYRYCSFIWENGYNHQHWHLECLKCFEAEEEEEKE